MEDKDLFLNKGGMFIMNNIKPLYAIEINDLGGKTSILERTKFLLEFILRGKARLRYKK